MNYKKKYKELGIDRINELFRYDEKTGLLYNKINHNRCHKNKIAGWVDLKGYRIVEIKNINYRQHLLIWMIHNNGNLPDGEIDHVNRNKSDNRIENLRDVTPSINNYNRVVYGKSKYRGVCWHKHSCKWMTRITINRNLKFIGYFDNEIDAAKAWDIEARNVDRKECFMNFPH